MERIREIMDINIETPEGQMLLAALAKITTESQTDKTPMEVLRQLDDLRDHMFDEPKRT